MNRRALWAHAWPIDHGARHRGAAAAGEDRPHRVRVTRLRASHLMEVFQQGLRNFAYVAGRNVVIEYRSAEGRLERLPILAAELVALKVDVIVTSAKRGAE